jgi:fibrillarin-like rRNA methylase
MLFYVNIMHPTKHPGIFKKNDKLFTQNPEVCKGIKVYNEQLITENNREYRSWNPYRSKLAAALLKELDIEITPHAKILTFLQTALSMQLRCLP